MTNITIEKVWRHSSVNSSGPTILGSGVQIPSTYFIWSPILYYICYSLCWEKDEKNSWKIINIIIILTIHNLLRQSLSLFLHKVLLNELIVVVAVVSGVIVVDHAVVLKPFHSGHDLWTQVLGWTPPFPILKLKFEAENFSDWMNVWSWCWWSIKRLPLRLPVGHNFLFKSKASFTHFKADTSIISDFKLQYLFS